MFYFSHWCHIVAVQLCPGSGAGKGCKVCPNLRVRGRIGSHLRKSWKIGVMPTFSTWPVISFFFPGVNTLFDKCQMCGPFSSRHVFFHPSFTIFIQHFLSLSSEMTNITSGGVYLVLSPADDQYWVFREADVLPGYPQPLREYGQGVPAHKIDTAIWWEPNGYTYFFSGDRCIF